MLQSQAWLRGNWSWLIDGDSHLSDLPPDFLLNLKQNEHISVLNQS